MSPRVSGMGKFEKLVDSPAGIEGFRAKSYPARSRSRVLLLGPDLSQEKDGAGCHSNDSFHRRRNDDPHGEDN